MKKFIKLLSILLAVPMLVGCSKKEETKLPSVGMTVAEREICNEIRKLYSDVKDTTINHYVFNVGYQMTDALLADLKEVMHGATLKNMIMKELYEFDEFTAYALAANYSDGAKEMVVNDIVLVAMVNDAPYIVLQQMYSPKAQAEIIDVCASYEKIAADIFTACNNKFGKGDPITTVFSISKTETNFTDSQGKIVCGAGGLVYDFTITLENIAKGVTGEPEDGEENVAEETAFKSDISPAAEKLDDGRELVWHLEFNGGSVNDLSNALNTGPDTMSPDRKVLFTSTGPENYFVKDGCLVLRITKDPTKNIYTTAKSVSTSGRMAYKYGYVEMRAIVPYQVGVWPSFWMQPDKKLKESELYNGEIDIFEVFGSTTTATFNLHKWFGGYRGSDTIGNRGNYKGNLNYKFNERYNLHREYHTYGFEWTKDYMKVYIDGECYYEVSIKEEDDYSTAYPGMDCFHDYYYLCWNNWLYTEYASTGKIPSEVDYKIDYVRLYQYEDSEYIHIYNQLTNLKEVFKYGKNY